MHGECKGKKYSTFNRECTSRYSLTINDATLNNKINNTYYILMEKIVSKFISITCQ